MADVYCGKCGYPHIPTIPRSMPCDCMCFDCSVGEHPACCGGVMRESNCTHLVEPVVH